MKLKVNKLSSRFIEIHSHTVGETVVVHIILFIIVGWLTLAAYKGKEGVLVYFGMIVTFFLFVIIVADTCLMISRYRSKRNAQKGKKNS